MEYTNINIPYMPINVHFTQEHATKPQKGSRGIALLFP